MIFSRREAKNASAAPRQNKAGRKNNFGASRRDNPKFGAAPTRRPPLNPLLVMASGPQHNVSTLGHVLNYHSDSLAPADASCAYTIL